MAVTGKWDADVLVVGGGPAGLAAAIAVRLAGFEVRVLDRDRPPIDKACGEGLMPDGVRRLCELGVAVDDGIGLPFRGIRYLDGEVRAEGLFTGSSGLGIRRTRLQQRLAQRAARIGVVLDWGLSARSLRDEGVETDAGPIRARWLVGADGLHSRLRRWAGLERGAGRFRRFGVSRHYAVAPWSDLVEVYWADGAEAYVTPVDRHEIGVALLWSGGRTSFDLLLDRFPALRSRLDGAPPRSRDRGAGPLHQKVRAVRTDRLALIGDASGYLDPITGEGLSLAFHQAFALAGALRRGDLSFYAAAHRRLAATPWKVTRRLLAVERHPWARRRLIRGLSRDPALFSKYLSVLAREQPESALGPAATFQLAWKLVSRARSPLSIPAALDGSGGVGPPRNSAAMPSSARLSRSADCSPE